ncbi:hypothetical protein AALT_g2214 [Alternaria alternata]|nr:hypothetical protein AALT_g2214 [Alternaria alternata]
MAERIQDFLGMTGLQETQQICQGQNLKRADPTEECVRNILRHAMDLADTGPENLMALAQANNPVEPVAGQFIGFPIPSISIGESVAFVQLYRQVSSATAPVPQADQNWNPSVLTKSALGLTIAVHASMFAGQTLAELIVSKNDIINDLKEEDLACAKDLICTLNNCQGQKELIHPITGVVSAKLPLTPTCLTPKNLGCRCGIVNYPYVYDVPQGYMDAQYEWLEELIKLADTPIPEPDCKDNVERFDNPRATLKGWIEKACAEHSNQLSEEWVYNYYDTPGFVGAIRWGRWPGGLPDCSFDCKTVFTTFLDSECVKDEGFSSTGEIKIECGTALLYAMNSA